MIRIGALEAGHGPVDSDAAARLLAAQQVRGHLVNPYLSARADLHAMRLRVEIAITKSDHCISIQNEVGDLRGFALLKEHRYAPGDINSLFLGLTGYQTLEFAVPPPKDPDSEAVAFSLAEAIAGLDSDTISVSIPIGSAWCENQILKANFTATGVESIRPPLGMMRSARHEKAAENVRRATPDDIDSTVELMLAEYAYHTPFHPIAAEEWSADRFADAFRQELSAAISDEDHSTVFVADVDGSVAGMLYLQTRRISDPTNALPMGTHVVIQDISVRSNVQGRGIGRNLIEATYHAFQKEPIVAFGLAYTAENPIARRLWPHLGFRSHRRSYVRKR